MNSSAAKKELKSNETRDNDYKIVETLVELSPKVKGKAS